MSLRNRANAVSNQGNWRGNVDLTGPDEATEPTNVVASIQHDNGTSAIVTLDCDDEGGMTATLTVKRNGRHLYDVDVDIIDGEVSAR